MGGKKTANTYSYAAAYKELKSYVINDTIKHHLEGAAKKDLLAEIEIIEHLLKNG